MTDEESTVLAAYVARELELPAPPTFLTCTATRLTRAAFMAFHQSHIEATLLADIPARVRLGRNIARRSILRELVDANGGTEDGKQRMKAFIKAAQRVVFDGHHTLSFVFMSRRAAAAWAGTTMKLRGCPIQLEMADSAGPGVHTPPQVARHYAIRILGTTELNAVELVQCFSNIAQDSILDIRHSGLAGLKEIDNDYWTVVFSSLECPVALQGVTSLILNERAVTLHHFQRAPTPPCYRCYNPNHTQLRCTVAASRLEQLRAPRQRRYVGPLVGVRVPQVPDCHDLLALERGFAEYVGGIITDMPLTAAPDHDFLEHVTAAESTPAEDGEAERQTTNPDTGTWQTIKRSKGHPSTTIERTSRPQQLKSTNNRSTGYQPGKTAAEAAAEDNGGSKKQRGRGHNTPNKTLPSSESAKAKHSAQRYKETCAVYAALEAENEEDNVTAKQESQSDAVSPHKSNDQQTVAANNPSASISEVDPDINMEVTLPLPNAAPSEAPIANVHSPLSEMQPSQEPFGQDASPETLQCMEVDEVVAASISTSTETQKDGALTCDASPALVEIVKVVKAPTTDQLTVNEWIGSLKGAPVLVPANGQCVFAALFATSTNMPLEKLTYTTEVVNKINQIKQAVLDVVLANLRYDVQLELVDPVLELRRLYPDDPAPGTSDAAIATLYAHYAAAQQTSVTVQVPQAFWEGTHILRAMAVYLREPLYVWDVHADSIAHVQQYNYQVYTMPNGDKHETGYVQPLPDSITREFVELCFHHHVIPPMLLLKHTEGHFYGVQHGDLFATWDNEDGPTMRNRLDMVHRAMKWPLADAVPYDPNALHDVATAEEEAILEDMGLDVYASGSQVTEVRDTHMNVQRIEPSVEAQAYSTAYERILTSANIDDASMADRRKARLMHRDNTAAAERWVALHGARHAAPTGGWVWADRFDWLTAHPLAFRSVLAFVPFPELVVQQCSPAQMSRWGRNEVYIQQTQMLRRISLDEEHDDATRAYCKSWHQACDGALTQTNLSLAKDSDRWNRLGQMVDSALLRNRPVSIDTEHWEILHTLPYAIRTWPQTVMGRADLASRAIWYLKFPQVENLCNDVAASKNWSGIANLPIGMARMDSSLSLTQVERRLEPSVRRN
ncbi:hypothetical protein PHMEG_00012116 [Phytophthora megakarya]|uniref:OTU domain-containing protein n=1 Tax=Phytophthora megakarya TaxID=4795 RepID=A0A225WA21_9STRA|nr:hypothetical protein PHMEG_00012116 [Phytophthora megakarya]